MKTASPHASRPWDALPKWPRRLISACLLFHLIAITSAPASVAPASQLARSTWSLCRPYLQLLYLNHGYHFFAPNPGESTLLAYTVEKPDGTTIDGAIPHPNISPRLLYHRHFMLTESLAFVANISEATQVAAGPPAAIAQPPDSSLSETGETLGTDENRLVELRDGEIDAAAPGSTDGADSVDGVVPPEQRGLLRDWYQSYANCVLKKHGGVRAELTRVVHYLPEMEWMQDSIARGEPLTLGEADSFTEFPVGVFALGHRLPDPAEPDEAMSRPQQKQTQPGTGLALSPNQKRGQP